MDTDDLTEMAYEMIRIAGDISEYLQYDIGVNSRKCHDEDAYLTGILSFLKEIVQYPEEYLQSWNLDDVDPQHFKAAVLGLVKHVSNTIAIPIAERGPKGFE